MAGKPLKSRYESEVHIGLMAIIFLLLLLNVVSNYVIYEARRAEQTEILTDLRQAGFAVSRLVQESWPESINPVSLDAARSAHGLSGLTLLPSKPTDNSREARRKWFGEVLKKFPPSRYEALAERLYRSELMQLSRDKGASYYLAYPVNVGSDGSLLILTVNSPLLAYLDDSREMVTYVFLGSVAVVALVYFFLSRFMFRPFRRIRQTAKAAGRMPGTEEDDSEAVVEEYERTIHQLTETQQELIRLNEEISGRADSLEQLNRYLMQSERTGVVTLNPAGQAMALNRAAGHFLGIDEMVGLGMGYRELMNPYPDLISDIGQALDGISVEGFREYSGIESEWSERTIGVTLTEVGSGLSEGRNLLLMISDLTELKRLRSELEQRQRLAALGEMAGGLAHQIRNSLGAICGYATLLKKRSKGSDESLAPAEALLEETRQADDLISRFLSFARPLDIVPAELNLTELIEDCIESFRIRPGIGKVEWQVDLARDIRIVGDTLLIKQALANLIDNAINACEGTPGVIEIYLSRATEQVEIRIEDSGAGIPQEYLDKIFTPFFSSRPSGTGLGLPLADKIIGLHKGTLAVESRAGEGTLFCVRLPAIESEAAAQHHSSSSTIA